MCIQSNVRMNVTMEMEIEHTKRTMNTCLHFLLQIQHPQQSLPCKIVFYPFPF